MRARRSYARNARVRRVAIAAAAAAAAAIAAAAPLSLSLSLSLPLLFLSLPPLLLRDCCTSAITRARARRRRLCDSRRQHFRRARLALLARQR